jgi:hypothetical protein
MKLIVGVRLLKSYRDSRRLMDLELCVLNKMIKLTDELIDNIKIDRENDDRNKKNLKKITDLIHTSSELKERRENIIISQRNIIGLETMVTTHLGRSGQVLRAIWKFVPRDTG